MSLFGRIWTATFVIVLEAAAIRFGLRALGEIQRSGLRAPLLLTNKLGEPASTPALVALLLCATFVVGSIGVGIWSFLGRNRGVIIESRTYTRPLWRR